MSAFALIPGAGGAGWYWHLVGPLLEEAGHEALAIDLPADDESAGLAEYAAVVTEAIGARDDVILVAQSFGGFTAPLVAERAPVRELVFVNAMVPLPGEAAGGWGEAVGAERERLAAAERGGYTTEFDLDVYFFHDVDPALVAAAGEHERDEADVAFETPCEFRAWPPVPIRAVAGREDRLFPPELQREVARERLGVELDLVPGGHLVALSRPRELAAYLLSSASSG